MATFNYSHRSKISPEIEVRKYLSSSTSQQQKLPIGATNSDTIYDSVFDTISSAFITEYIEFHPLFDGIEYDVAIIGLAGAMQR